MHFCQKQSSGTFLDHTKKASISHHAMLSHFSRVQLFETQWTSGSCLAPLSMGFSGQEYWTGCHVFLWESPQPRDRTLVSWIADRFFTAEPPGSQFMEPVGFQSSLSYCSVSFWFCPLSFSIHLFSLCSCCPFPLLLLYFFLVLSPFTRLLDFFLLAFPLFVCCPNTEQEDTNSVSNNQLLD